MSIFRRIFAKQTSAASGGELQEALFEFMQTDSWAAAEIYLRARPDLMSQAAEELLADLVTSASKRGDQEAFRLFGEHRILLLRCRIVGIEQAFQEKMGKTQEAEEVYVELPEELGVPDEAPSPDEQRQEGLPEPPAVEPIVEKEEPTTQPEQVSTSELFSDLHSALEYVLEIQPEKASQAMLERRLEICSQALEQVSLLDQPLQWAAFHLESANSLAKMDGERHLDNLERAILEYFNALEVYTRKGFPRHWATVHNNLGTTFCERLAGSREENIEQAIHHCQQALKVFTTQDYPEQWASAQSNLASALCERVKGKAEKNIDLAINHYEQALQVYTPDLYPLEWAQIQGSIAEAFRDHPRGKKSPEARDENLRQAYQHYHRALEVYNRQEHPLLWAGVNARLADLLYDRGGAWDELHEQSLAHYLKALQVYTRQTTPERWAGVHMNLGALLRERTQGERSENLERAIHHYQRALEVYTPETHPEMSACILDNIATTMEDLNSLGL